MAHTWDPDRYLTYADERGRPFVELVARIGAAAPAEVVDLGCGAGNLTGLLAERWPDAHVVGLDSSPEMIAAGPGSRPVGDLRRRRPARLAARAAGRRTGQQCDAPVGPGPPRAAALAGRRGGARRLVRLPGARQLRRAEPHDPGRAGRRGAVRRAHRERRHAVLARPGRLLRRADRSRLLGGRLGDDVHARAPRSRPCLHLGVRHRRPTDPAGAAERPAAGFEAEFKRRLAAAYPVRADGTVLLPFRRVFAVARVGS